MKRLVIFWSLLTFTTHGLVLASDFKGLFSSLLGKKVIITEDRRPGGTAVGKIGTVTKMEKANWMTIDFERGYLDIVLGDLPSGYKEWDPRSDLPKDKTKPGAILLGRPLITLEDGTKMALDGINFKCKFADENEEKRLVTELAAFMAAMKVRIELGAVIEQKPPPPLELPEPELTIRTDLGSANYIWPYPLETIGGKSFDLTSAYGQVVFINIWATWCQPCIMEMPGLQKLYDRLKDEVVFLFISSEDAATVSNWAQKNKYTLPLYLTPAPTIISPFKTEGIPATFILSSSGQIVFRKVGAAKWDGQATIDFLRSPDLRRTKKNQAK